MRRADRLLQIVQILRRAKGRPISAREIAGELEVTSRTIYRDMVSLESVGVPIRGEAGVGYVLEDGLDLPPLIFNSLELETLILGARWVETHGDKDQQIAARDIVAKVAAVLPDHLRDEFFDVSLYAPAGTEGVVSSSELRQALRSGKIIELEYIKEDGAATKRRAWPISLGYFDFKRLLLCWCELRQDFRAFRADRIQSIEILDKNVPKSRAQLKKEWWEVESIRQPQIVRHTI
ncbi:helix-turn-helix transcriptional regulator [Maritalea sp. S77]|uniref:helix-turn-helix transcriptional regulator n=1 Tax=Maritalea sp. S77 TaxID=3415125 RepID=UPI003C7BA13B